MNRRPDDNIDDIDSEIQRTRARADLFSRRKKYDRRLGIPVFTPRTFEKAPFHVTHNKLLGAVTFVFIITGIFGKPFYDAFFAQRPVMLAEDIRDVRPMRRHTPA